MAIWFERGINSKDVKVEFTIKGYWGSSCMEAMIEEVIKDINMSLPERKLKQLIERTNLSADVKAIMSDIVHVTVKVGGKVLAIGRKILTFVLDLVKTFPAIAMGTIAALVITAVVGAVPLIGAPLAAFLGPILLVSSPQFQCH
ncbi:hypothetical protein [Nereida ignava]|uniref:hypothetical protein n=1 Tax=Nereida ignava TaxID=282199 RepID=UPI0015A6DB07|nr:hypothetical protein [Nereida ignava]